MRRMGSGSGSGSGRPGGRRIAIVGAGGTGTCTALELAARGHEVDLFEKQDAAVSQASFANEGKIHLGFIYAKDGRMRTAARMIEGALEFEENLQRWMPFRAADVVSTPFYYGVHRGSLLEPDALARHYERCCALYRERAKATGRDYLGLRTGCAVTRLKEKEYADWLDPAHFTAVFRTTERAVDPRAIALCLREAVDAEPRIRFHPRHRVRSVQRLRRGGFLLSIESGRQRLSETFTDVVNSSWYERLPIDRALGITPPRAWSHRYKFANRVGIPLEPADLPSCTTVQGPFGDIVNFGERGLFLSWYPIGRTGMSTEETPPSWHSAYSDEERRGIFVRSLREWKKRCQPLGGLPVDSSPVDPDGGVIYALGTTDVDDRRSDLHHRWEIGIQSRDGYHSVDTGKYTLVPFWGLRVADRVEGIS